MNERQFELLMEKLDIIRCGIIDVETEAQVIKVLAQQHLTQKGSEPSEICPLCLGRGSYDKSRNGNLEYGTCDKCGGSGKLLPC